MTTSALLAPCPRGFLGRHRFEARYDEERKWPEWANRVTSMKNVTEEVLETRRTYVYDVCTICGATINR
jgi:hypothetical protein